MEPKELKEKYAGSLVVMVTPFKKDYSLDEEGLRYNTRFLIKNGVHALHPTGSTGEFFSLTPEEHKKVIKTVVDEAEGKVPVVPGTSHSGTKLTVELSKYAEDAGADGVMVLPPYYIHPDVEGVYEHYKRVAESVHIGIVVYSNPWTSKVHITPELMAKLAEIPNIVAIKECHDMGLTVRMFKLLKGKIALTTGWGEYLAPFCYMIGGQGSVTEFGNIAPRIGVEMYEAAQRKDWAKVMELYFKALPFFELEYGNLLNPREIMPNPKFIPMVKEAMNILDLPAGPPRSPLLPLSNEEKKEIRSVLKKVGLLTC